MSTPTSISQPVPNHDTCLYLVWRYMEDLKLDPRATSSQSQCCPDYHHLAGTFLTDLSSETPAIAETSYGCQKQIIELYTYDYGRKGLLETRSVRLPTVAIRSGAVSCHLHTISVTRPHSPVYIPTDVVSTRTRLTSPAIIRRFIFHLRSHP